MSNGFVIMAFNNQTTNYVALANTLKRSIHRVMPDARVTLITDSDVQDSEYDHIIKTRDVDGTEWKLSNDWLIYENSPYDRTIKLEADMYIPRKIDHWWDILEGRDLNICTTIRDYKGNISTNTFYRDVITSNKLPDTYNAITYFQKSNTAETFYEYVKDIFMAQDKYAEFIKVNREEKISTDVVYSVAAGAIGVENCTMPNFTDFSMVHMKKMINTLVVNKWYKQLVYELQPHTFRVQTIPQMYPFHYHDKEFGKVIDEELQ